MCTLAATFIAIIFIALKDQIVLSTFRALNDYFKILGWCFAKYYRQIIILLFPYGKNILIKIKAYYEPMLISSLKKHKNYFDITRKLKVQRKSFLE